MCLPHPRVIDVSGCLRCSGSEADAGETDTARALGRMASWAKVARGVSKIDFPEYDVLARSKRSLCPRPELVSSDIARLSHIAKIFNVDLAKLV